MKRSIFTLAIICITALFLASSLSSCAHRTDRTVRKLNKMG